MTETLDAHASIRIAAGPERVWRALVDPDQVREYMFGAEVRSDWREGSPITWSGEWKGKQFEDKGEILEVAPARRLRYTHYSPLTGEPDVPSSYHTVTIELAPAGESTDVELDQSGNADAKSREHSEQNWSQMLEGLKRVVERGDGERAPD